MTRNDRNMRRIVIDVFCKRRRLLLWKNTTGNNLWVVGRLGCNVGVKGEVNSSSNNKIHLGEEERSSDGRKL